MTLGNLFHTAHVGAEQQVAIILPLTRIDSRRLSSSAKKINGCDEAHDASAFTTIESLNISLPVCLRAICRRRPHHRQMASLAAPYLSLPPPPPPPPASRSEPQGGSAHFLVALPSGRAQTSNRAANKLNRRRRQNHLTRRRRSGAQQALDSPVARLWCDAAHSHWSVKVRLGPVRLDSVRFCARQRAVCANMNQSASGAPFVSHGADAYKRALVCCASRAPCQRAPAR